jgi:hypothetical protein
MSTGKKHDSGVAQGARRATEQLSKPSPAGGRWSAKRKMSVVLSVATLATRLCGKVFGFVKRNLSGAERRMGAAKRRKGCGERGGSPFPRLSTQKPGARLAL